MEIIPNWHPAFVHFTVALLTVSTLLFLVSKLATNWRLEDQWLATAYWNLWIGTLVTIGTAIAGWYAFNTVEHDTESHKVMLEHRNYALSTLAVFVVLAVWAIFQYRAAKRPSAIFIIAAFVGWGLVLTTAWHGGELVYRHGLGVMALPKVGPHSHANGAEDHGHPEDVGAHGHVDDGHAHDGAATDDHHQDALEGGNADHHDSSSAAPHSHDMPNMPAEPAPAAEMTPPSETAPPPPAEMAPPPSPAPAEPASNGSQSAPAEGSVPEGDASVAEQPAGEPAVSQPPP